MTHSPSRKPTRLNGYDYAQNGAYFVTICTQNREVLFGDVVDSNMRLNSAGEIVLRCWNDLVKHYPHAEFDAFVVMPNHIHGIVIIVAEETREGHRPSPTAAKAHGLPQIIGSLKSYSAKRINERRDTPGASVWQRTYHDHIIRDETDLNTRRQYILSNPARWQEDAENPTRYLPRS